MFGEFSQGVVAQQAFELAPLLDGDLACLLRSGLVLLPGAQRIAHVLGILRVACQTDCGTGFPQCALRRLHRLHARGDRFLRQSARLDLSRDRVPAKRLGCFGRPHLAGGPICEPRRPRVALDGRGARTERQQHALPRGDHALGRAASPRIPLGSLIPAAGPRTEHPRGAPRDGHQRHAPDGECRQRLPDECQRDAHREEDKRHRHEECRAGGPGA